eukprot:Hpha_TRINITY_DN16668_c0_g3::TRINITY_DN16668_c0_g3_i6::g.178261::m.178261
MQLSSSSSLLAAVAGVVPLLLQMQCTVLQATMLHVGVVHAQPQLLDEECVIAADLWSPEPKILSSSAGFDGIIGLQRVTRQNVLAAGGAWDDTFFDKCPGANPGNPPTQTAGTAAINRLYFCEEEVDHDDGMPVCFSWPVLPSSISPANFLIRRSDGAEVVPKCASSLPNFELNERHCVVIFGNFFNRKDPGEEGALWMTQAEVIGPLTLIGPNGTLVSAQGLTWSPPDPLVTSYQSGPVMTAARLVPLHAQGEGTPKAYPTLPFLPNSGVDSYGNGDDLYRLRFYYSGGMTVDGFTPPEPSMFDDYFTLVFSTGQELSVSGQSMTIDGTDTSLTVLGLADVGVNWSGGCFNDDRDNYQDIIIRVQGNPSSLHHLESLRGFDKGRSYYNPGGPGPTPFEGVRYTAAAPAHSVAVVVDLERVYETTYCMKNDGTVATDVETCTLWQTSGLLRTLPLGGAPPVLTAMPSIAATEAPTGAPSIPVPPSSSSRLSAGYCLFALFSVVVVVCDLIS